MVDYTRFELQNLQQVLSSAYIVRHTSDRTKTEYYLAFYGVLNTHTVTFIALGALIIFVTLTFVHVAL